MDTIDIDGKEFKGLNLKTENASLLMIQGSEGFLGCGYFDIATANKLGEHVAIVTGVSSYDDMLEANVVKVSEAAAQLGVKENMNGREALTILG